MKENNNELFLSVIIPTYNEGGSIKKNVGHINNYLKSAGYSYEILVVDDGSSDATLSMVKQLSEEVTLRVFTSKRNRGKGYAVRKGMLESEGKFSLFLDADLSTGIEELPKILKGFEEGFDIVIGSRRLKHSVVLVHQNLRREFLGRIFTKLTNLLLVKGVSDITCGFKAFSRQAVKDIFSKQKDFGWSFDAEILYLAQRKGYRIKEIPITWRDELDSKVRVARDMMSSLAGLIRIEINIFTGKY